MKEDLFYKLLILRSPGVGPAKYRKILEMYLGDVKAAAQSLLENPLLVKKVEDEMDLAMKLGVHYIEEDSDYYPSVLKQYKNSMPIITARGNIEALKQKMVSMVGTRHATAAGMQFMSQLAFEFAARNIAVVSGMAMGTDTAAHKGALKSESNTATIAVLAGGVDVIWPLENEGLYHQIIKQGCVISEAPVGFNPQRNSFAQRNRWVAALGDKLIIGEADLKSGSIITARFAIDYEKEVYAIPSHPSDERSAGPNELIKSGDAKICTSVFDFFDEEKNKKTNRLRIDETENDLLSKIGIIPVSESVLASLVQKSISETKAELVMLEVRGLVRKHNGGYVRV